MIKCYWARLTFKFHWLIARAIPKRAALYAYVRVCAIKGDCPDPMYSEYYNAWCNKHKLGNV